MQANELFDRPNTILLDGGMGTMLQARGLGLGEHPELAALEHRDWVVDIHRQYAQAGSQILCANTFGANREKLRRTGCRLCSKAAVCVSERPANRLQRRKIVKFSSIFFTFCCCCNSIPCSIIVE